MFATLARFLAYTSPVLLFVASGVVMALSHGSPTTCYAAMLANIGGLVLTIAMSIAFLIPRTNYLARGGAWTATMLFGALQASLQAQGSSEYLYWLMATAGFALGAYGAFSAPIRPDTP